MSQKNKLINVAKLFFKLGCVAFGGPAAHIGMMEDEVVKKRQWMTQEHFLDLIGATNLIPGPNSTELTMHIGYEQAGWRGLIVAGVCFIFPAVVITAIFAWLYQDFGQLPNVEPFIYGIKPAVIAIILMAAFKLGKKAIKNLELAVLGVLALATCFLGINEITVLFSCAAIGIISFLIKKSFGLTFSIAPLLVLSGQEVFSVNNLKIFLTFLKVGAILYGSGYVLFAFLDTELVTRGWLTRQVLIDAVAVGQITPGPVLSTATFIGWQMQGLTGALVATLGIFLPSFLFVLVFNPLISKMQNSKMMRAVLDAVNVAAVALIVVICIKMGQDTLMDWRSTTILILSIIVVFVFKKMNSVLIVVGGSLLGYIFQLL